MSALLLAGAVIAASSAGEAEEELGKDTPRAAQRATTDLPRDKGDLAAMFSPGLVFTHGQRWTPIAVDDYVRGARIRDWERRPSRVRAVKDLDTDCPGVVKSPCYVIKQRCPKHKDDARCAEDLPDAKAVYMRVAHRSDWSGCRRHKACFDGSPNPFAAAVGMYARNTKTLLQYWYFYPFNEWIASLPIGDLKQVHPADWEAVTIGLSRPGTTLGRLLGALRRHLR